MSSSLLGPIHVSKSDLFFNVQFYITFLGGRFPELITSLFGVCCHLLLALLIDCIFIFCLFRATPVAHGDSQAGRSNQSCPLAHATATDSNTGSDLLL